MLNYSGRPLQATIIITLVTVYSCLTLCHYKERLMYVLVKKIPSLNFFSEPPWHSQTGRLYWLQILVSDDRDTVLKYDIKWTSTRAGVGQKWAQVDTGKGGTPKFCGHLLWTAPFKYTITNAMNVKITCRNELFMVNKYLSNCMQSKSTKRNWQWKQQLISQKNK